MTCMSSHCLGVKKLQLQPYISLCFKKILMHWPGSVLFWRMYVWNGNFDFRPFMSCSRYYYILTLQFTQSNSINLNIEEDSHLLQVFVIFLHLLFTYLALLVILADIRQDFLLACKARSSCAIYKAVVLSLFRKDNVKAYEPPINLSFIMSG